MPFKNFRISKKLSDLPTIPLGELKELQGGLKELSTVRYNKLKYSIEKHGFFLPFHMWVDDDGLNRIVDGHQRRSLLIREKVPLDTPMPVVYIEADSLRDAKEKLLVISSQYGLITQEGYDAFTFDLDEGELELLVNFDALKVWPTDEESDTGNGEGDSENEDSQPIVCPHCGGIID